LIKNAFAIHPIIGGGGPQEPLQVTVDMSNDVASTP